MILFGTHVSERDGRNCRTRLVADGDEAARRVFQKQDQPADSSPTLLSTPAPPAVQSPAAAPKSSDPAPRARGSFQSTASPDLVSSRTEEPFPPLEPLPLAQARPNQAQAARRGQQPAPATPGARTAVPPRPAQPRPAAAGVQQQQEIQFDPNGMVSHFHVPNEGDLRQILELTQSTPWNEYPGFAQGYRDSHGQLRRR